MRTPMKLFVGVLGCLALGAQAEPAAPHFPPGLISMEQTTIVHLGPNGRPTVTERFVRVMMTEGKRAWSTMPSFEYTVTNEKGETSAVNPMVWEDMAEKSMHQLGKPTPSPVDGVVAKVNDKGQLGPKMEDGIEVKGLWWSLTWPPAGNMPARTERVERWFRPLRDAQGRVGLHPHREIVTSADERKTKDWWYIKTDRIHPSMFSTATNP